MNEKKRLSVPMSQKIYNRVVEDAENLGVSPSSFVNYIIGNYYKQLDMSMGAAEDVIKKALNSLLTLKGVDSDKLHEIALDEKTEQQRKMIESFEEKE